MADPTPRTNGSRLPHVDWRTIFAGITAASVLIVGLSWLMTKAETGAQVARDLQAMESRLTSSMGELKGGLAAVNTTVSQIPLLAARLEHVESRLTDGDARDREMERRLGAVERLGIELKVQLDAIIRASRPPSPPEGG